MWLKPWQRWDFTVISWWFYGDFMVMLRWFHGDFMGFNVILWDLMFFNGGLWWFFNGIFHVIWPFFKTWEFLIWGTIYKSNIDVYTDILMAGWWFQPTSLKNMSQLSQLGLFFPIYGNIKFMFQTTNQDILMGMIYGTTFWRIIHWRGNPRNGDFLTRVT